MNALTKNKIKSKCPHRLWKAMVTFIRALQKFKYRIDMALFSKKMTLYCPCCGFKLKRFVEGEYLQLPDFYYKPLFESIRQDLLCPVCGSLPRHRILASWCEANKDLLTSKDILYFAPERSMTAWLKSNKIRFTTADLYNVDTDLKLDIQSTGLASDSYDVVICNHVLEHVDDYMTALKEIRRILRPDGILICSFPISPDVEYVYEDPDIVTDHDRLVRYGQSDHVRLFGMKADRFISDAGYDVTFIDGNDYPEQIIPITGPGRYDIDRLFLCRVKAG